VSHDEIGTLKDVNGDLVMDREQVIDPRWGMEQIIAHLAGFAPDDVTPFNS
jgi:hypothetical protein